MSTEHSLILITVDCLRADHTGFGGYDQPTTPGLDRLAQESLVFPTAIVGGPPTYYSFPAILGGRHPLALGRDVLGMAPGEPTLASVLRGRGYATAGFSAGNVYLSQRFGYGQGFDVFHDHLDAASLGGEPSANDAAARAQSGCEPGEIRSHRVASRKSQIHALLARGAHALGPLGRWYDDAYFRYGQAVARRRAETMDQLRRYPAADVLVDQAAPWLAGVAGQPFFLWLHLMDPHHPYYPPEVALAAMGRPDLTAQRAQELNSQWNRGNQSAAELQRYRADVMALYDAGIRWMDMQVERLMGVLEQFGLSDSTVVALTADHGEEFLEAGRRYHAPVGLAESLIRVPLIIKAPGVAGRRMSAGPFSHVNLPGTLLQAVSTAPGEVGSASAYESEAKSEAEPFQGKGLWSEIQSGLWEGSDPVVTECVEGCTNPFRRERRQGYRLISARGARYKLVWRLVENGKGSGSRTGPPSGEQLYDLLADPEERTPLAVCAEPVVRRQLMEAVREHLRRSWQERPAEARLRAQLRDLRLEGRSAFE